MSPETEAQIWVAVGSLAITAIGVIGTLVFFIRKWISAKFGLMIAQLEAQKKELERNSAITAQVESQTNGQLAAARDEATKFRATAERLYALFQELNRTEIVVPVQDGSTITVTGKQLLDQAANRHRTVIHDAEFDGLLDRLLTTKQK